MGQTTAVDTGYTAAQGASTDKAFMGDSDLYMTNGYHAGILKFNASINTILGLNASSWDQLDITAADITLRCNGANMAYDGYTVKISHALYNHKGTAITQVAAEASNLSFTNSAATTSGSTRRLTLDPVFKSISSAHGFTPSTTTWYMYIINAKNNTDTKRFDRLSQSSGSLVLTLTGKYKSTLHYYTSATAHTMVIPKYWTGTEWKNVIARYWDGSKWNPPV